jgi:exodeoxyribonuclease VII large subunit
MSEATSVAPQIYSVEQLNSHIRNMIEGQLPVIWLQAEISNFKPHSSGHFYFSLKDSKSQISAVMFRGFNSKLKFKPHDGLEVLIRGRITVYEPRGSYQLACESMEPVGAGALQKQFEQLKEKLKAEGLFDSARKKQIPALPQSIAVVTSPTGAAIQDILNIMRRRAKSVEVTVVPTIVQGAAAAPKIYEAFLAAQRLKPDVIIIGRGGGSVEDMWCFNDEKLARLIAASDIPVISAVGHEIDFTICDFVSDLRAPTPSAAAELVSKNTNDLIQKIGLFDRSLKNSIIKSVNVQKQKLNFYSRRLIDPKKRLQDLIQRNDELFMRLESSMYSRINNLQKDTEILKNRLINPAQVIQNKRAEIKNLNLKLQNKINQKISDQFYKLNNLKSLAHSLSPLQVVDRGYSISKIKDKVVKSIKQIKADDILDIRLADGDVRAQILEITKLKKD